MCGAVKLIDKLWEISKKICEIAIVIQGAILIFMAVYICTDVFARKIFAYSIKGSIELSSYSLAIMSGWIYSYALLTKAHVRIDILYLKFPKRMKLIADFIAYLSLLVFFAPLTYYSFEYFKTSWVRESVANTPLHTPLWIPQSLWVAGLIFFVWVVFLSLVKMVVFLAQGDIEGAHKLGGIITVEEEIEREKGIK